MDGFQHQSSDKNNNNYKEEKNDSSKETEDAEFSQPEQNAKNINPKSQDEILSEMKENASSKNASKSENKYSSSSVNASNTVQDGNIRQTPLLGSILHPPPSEVHSDVNPSLKNSSANFEPGKRSESVFCLSEEKKSSTAVILYEQTACKRTPSTSFHAVNEEKCDMSLEEEKLLSLTKDKDIFMESLERVSKRARLDSQNISVPPNLNQSALLSGHRELNTDISVVSGYSRDETMSSELTSEENCRSCDMSLYVKEPINLTKDANAVAGPSGIRPQILGHTKKIKPICHVCHKGFTNNYKYKMHYRIHTGEKPFECDKCKKTFALKKTLDNHYRTHTGEKPFQCDKCKNKFAQKGTLDRHYLTHTGEKSFECDKCENTFTTKGNLKRHYLTHTGEKPFECDKCKNTFSQKGTLDRHYRTHTGEKPFQCDKCKKTFALKQTLNNYYRTHTGEKPFQCDKCKKTC